MYLNFAVDHDTICMDAKKMYSIPSLDPPVSRGTMDHHRSGAILVVDDSADNRDLLSRWLQRHGYTVDVASNGIIALEKLRTHTFDLVLLDVIMPQMNGFQVLEQMKADPLLGQVAVIVISAVQDLCSTVRCIELGAEDYITKPFNGVLLNARVNACLEKKRLREQEQISLLSRLAWLGTTVHDASVDHFLAVLETVSNQETPANLSMAINQMLATVEQAQIERQRAQDMLKALNATLEQRVAERSAAAERRANDLERSEAALRQQTSVLQSILDSIGDGVIVVDADGTVLHCNPAARRLFANTLNAESLDLDTMASYFYLPDTVTPCSRDATPLAQAMRGEASDGTEIVVRLPADRAGRWMSVTTRPFMDEQTGAHGGVAVFHDITTARQAAAALQASEERYALAARGANDGLWDWDLKANQFYFSPRWKAMLGYREDEVGSDPQEWFSRIHPDDSDRVQLHLDAHFKGLISHFESEHRIRHKDGEYRWVLCRGLAVWDEANQVTRMAGSQTDITDRKHAEEQLRYGALHDMLTGLPNRALCLDRLQCAITRVKHQTHDQFAVMCFDLDRFKTLNDSLGYMVGDQLLVAFAHRVRACLQPDDTLARPGGDEFIILIERSHDIRSAIQIAEQIYEVLTKPFDVNGHEVFISVSCGIVLGTAAYDHPEDVLRDADTAMYYAKSRGKAQYAIFDATMHTHAVGLLQIEADLRRAIDRQELALHYQPIVALETGRVAGFEALLRWEHPQRGFIPPSEFIPIAEDTGLIIPIGRWALTEACRQMCRWRTQFPVLDTLFVSVNISCQQFMQPDLVEQIELILHETGMEPSNLKLEITESVLMRHGEARLLLARLRALAVQFSIDDFGTGYSSLSYLQRLPINTLKIDRSFVNDIDLPGTSVSIIQAILALAHSLGMTTVAEGIETADQLERLRTLHCDYGQGWWFSKALDPHTATALLATEACRLQAVQPMVA